MRLNRFPFLAPVCLLVAACAVSPSFAFAQTQTVAQRLGYPKNARLLVIHADDFGMDHSVDRAIEQALENHWVTSASILVPCPWFPEVVKWAHEHPDADLGIHLALNSEWTSYRWGPVASKDRVPSLLDKDGYLPLTETDVDKQAKPAEADIELRAQVDRAKAAGIHLSHLDTHMGTVATTADLFKVYLGLGRAYGLPLLLERVPEWQGVPVDQSLVLVDKVLQIQPGVPDDQIVQTYEKMLTDLPPGVYQLIVHLGYDDDELRGATYDHPDWGAAWRQRDFKVVQSAEFQSFLKQRGFVLVSWGQLGKALPKHF